MTLEDAGSSVKTQPEALCYDREPPKGPNLINVEEGLLGQGLLGVEKQWPEERYPLHCSTYPHPKQTDTTLCQLSL